MPHIHAAFLFPTDAVSVGELQETIGSEPYARPEGAGPMSRAAQDPGNFPRADLNGSHAAAEARANRLRDESMGLFDGSSSGGAASPDEVSFPALAAALKTDSWTLVDVREAQEFDAGHVAGSVNLPLSSFDPTDLPKDRPVVLICRSGVRSATALSRARGAGVADIKHYRGGVLGWANEGGELV
jgi:rhodanese-related sulfurtransferase